MCRVPVGIVRARSPRRVRGPGPGSARRRSDTRSLGSLMSCTALPAAGQPRAHRARCGCARRWLYRARHGERRNMECDSGSGTRAATRLRAGPGGSATSTRLRWSKPSARCTAVSPIALTGSGLGELDSKAHSTRRKFGGGEYAAAFEPLGKGVRFRAALSPVCACRSSSARAMAASSRHSRARETARSYSLRERSISSRKVPRLSSEATPSFTSSCARARTLSSGAPAAVSALRSSCRPALR